MDCIIKKRHHIVTHIAEILHRWHCKENHGKINEANLGCTWMQESWEPLSVGGVKQEFFDKAARVYEFYTNPDDCLKFLKFLQIVNPKLCYQLIKDL